MFVGPKECEMVRIFLKKIFASNLIHLFLSVSVIFAFQTDEFGHLYGFTESHIACKLKGTYIGPYNIELYVSNYGTSQTENELVHVDSLGQPFLFHTLADIETINAMSGT